MLFKVYRTSDHWQAKPTLKEINTLEELIAFRREVDENIIIKVEQIPQGDEGSKYGLEIYDDYRE